MNGKLFLVIALCILLVNVNVDAKKAKKAKSKDAPAEQKNEGARGNENKEQEVAAENEGEEADEYSEAEGPQEENDEEQDDEKDEKEKDDAKDEASEAEDEPTECDVKYKKIACYNSADAQGRGAKPLEKFVMQDDKFNDATSNADFNKGLAGLACACAKKSLNEQKNAVFGLEKINQCWTGSDDSKYDQFGASNECISFDKKLCGTDENACTGKDKSIFVYYIDAESHTKSEEEKQNERAALEQKQKEEEEKKKAEKEAKKAEKSKKKAAKKAKHAKKSKKSKH